MTYADLQTLKEAEAEFLSELEDLWIIDPPIIEDEDSVVSEDDDLNPRRDGGAEISE